MQNESEYRRLSSSVPQERRGPFIWTQAIFYWVRHWDRSQLTLSNHSPRVPPTLLPIGVMYPSYLFPLICQWHCQSSMSGSESVCKLSCSPVEPPSSFSLHGGQTSQNSFTCLTPPSRSPPLPLLLSLSLPCGSSSLSLLCSFLQLSRGCQLVSLTALTYQKVLCRKKAPRYFNSRLQATAHLETTRGGWEGGRMGGRGGTVNTQTLTGFENITYHLRLEHSTSRTFHIYFEYRRWMYPASLQSRNFDMGPFVLVCSFLPRSPTSRHYLQALLELSVWLFVTFPPCSSVPLCPLCLSWFISGAWRELWDRL